jgi:hypothetical protein
MEGLDRLDQFSLGAHGDRHEHIFRPLLSNRFPSYEILWRRLIVPLTGGLTAMGVGVGSRVGAAPALV